MKVDVDKCCIDWKAFTTGHLALRVPVCHCLLNLMGFVWGNMKQFVAFIKQVLKVQELKGTDNWFFSINFLKVRQQDHPMGDSTRDWTCVLRWYFVLFLLYVMWVYLMCTETKILFSKADPSAPKKCLKVGARASRYCSPISQFRRRIKCAL